jgi:hypothetical protein
MSSTPKKSVKLEQNPTPTRIEFVNITSVASPKSPAFADDRLTKSSHAIVCQENPDIRLVDGLAFACGCLLMQI